MTGCSVPFHIPHLEGWLCNQGFQNQFPSTSLQRHIPGLGRCYHPNHDPNLQSMVQALEQGP